MNARWVLLVLALHGAHQCAAAGEMNGKPYPEAESVFRSDPRWLGSDGAVSTALGNDRIFWSFDDSFVTSRAGAGRAESVMVRNSIAVQSGLDPAKAKMRFFWGSSGDGEPGAFFPSPVDAWYWTGAAIRIDEGPLVSFLFRMLATPGKGLGFANDGHAVAVIDNPDADPETWLPRITVGPVLPFDAVPAAALVRDGDYVVGFALRETGVHAATLVRYPVLDLARGRLDGAEWWAGANSGWVAAQDLGPAGPQYIIDDAGAECSVHWEASMQRYVHVATYGFGAAEIGLRFAEQLTGPWTRPQMVYRPPESDVPGLLVYGAMAHPAWTRPPAGELLLTYATNSGIFEDLFSAQGMKGLYWPRVVRVPLYSQ